MTGSEAAPPLRIVVMGVSGSGKTTVAKAIGTALHLTMVDGDDLHAPESIVKMKAGIALDDLDRWPWLDRVAAFLQHGSRAEPSYSPSYSPPQSHSTTHSRELADEDKQGRIVACSALKLSYRDHLRRAAPGLKFVFLDGDGQLIHRRMALRTGHFMHLELLKNQLRTLQRPTATEEDVITLQTAIAIDDLVDQVAIALQQRKWLPDELL